MRRARSFRRYVWVPMHHGHRVQVLTDEHRVWVVRWPRG